MNRRFLVVMLVFVGSAVALMALNRWHLSRFGAATGRVVDGATGAPIAGATVRLTGRFPAGADELEIVRASETDEEGRFRLRQLVTGSYSLEVFAPDGRAVHRDGLALRSGEENDLGVIEMPPKD